MCFFQVFSQITEGLSPEHKWSITLDNVKPEDSGKYMCKVFNRFGAINHTYTVSVVGECPQIFYY